MDSKVLDGVSVVRLVPQKKEVGQGNQAEGWPLIRQIVGPVALWVRRCFFSQWVAETQILEVRVLPGPLCYFSFILYYGSFILCLSLFVLVSFPLSLSFSLFCFLVVVLSHCFCVWVLFYTVFISFVVLSCFFSAFGLYDLVSSFFFSLVFIVSCLSLAVYLSLLINFTIPISPACLVEVPIAVNQNPSSQCQLLLFLVLNSVSFFLHPVEIRPFQGWFAHICSFVPHNWEHVLRSKSFYIDFDSIRWRFHRKCF